MANDLLDRAADLIALADALLIGAGAGMGVDSGLPDFRGDHGFWRAYPPYAAMGLNFRAMANPQWFERDPELAWGFYGHRGNLYRRTVPHEGFAILRRWAERMRLGGFVVTSNVDGQFQRAGFDPGRIVEVHGTIDALQCTRKCGVGIFEAGAGEVPVDETTMRAVPPLPECPSCGALARPNILMFGDWDWHHERSEAQTGRFRRWREPIGQARLAIVECGAGSAVPTIRLLCEDEACRPGARLIRINPREPDVPEGQIGLATGALAALSEIEARLVA